MSEFADNILRAGAYVVRLARRVTPLLVPGSGWSGATAQPDAVGDSQAVGYNAKAIARWDVVPFQTFSSTMNVGVVAFHREGINRVEFAVNGGDWRSVTTPRLNPTTGVVEYFVALRASDFADGPVEVRAIAYPTVGEPRVLAGALTGTDAANRGEHSMLLNANANGSLLSPVRYVSTTGSNANNGLTPETAYADVTYAANRITAAQGNSDGGIIYLLAGSHSIPGAAFGNENTTVNRWLTIKPAPGLTKADVTVTGTTFSGLNSKLVKFEDVTITGGINSGGPLVDYLWLDNCLLNGPGQDVGSITPGASWSGRWYTSSTFQNVANGAIDANLVRNCIVQDYGGDAFSNSGIVVNCIARRQDPRTQLGTYHPDIYQHVGTPHNIIVYGLSTSELVATQGFAFEVAPVDVAIVDVDVNASFLMQTRPYTHIYIKDSAVRSLVGPGLTATNVVYDGVTFYERNWTNASPPSGFVVR
jgi:hypothetical protein